ncbi:MAG: aspartate kinase, partial [Treponema sp.]|nr:aspartate kinase [Treponema sp.]
MLVMKFGGTSMGSAERMCNSAAIIRDRARSSRVGVVVSAVSGISNMLQDSIVRLFKETGTVTPAQFTREVKDRHDTIIADLASSVSEFSAARVQEQLAPIYTEYEQLLSASAAFGECPDTVECRILGMGERLSVPIMAEILSAAGEDLRVLDSRDYIITDGGPVREADPAFDKIENAFMPLRGSGETILLMGGFVSSDVSGKQTLLGRNGSDFSAALMAMGLDAKQLEIWSDVDGIYTADPRIVPDAELVHDISYEEAMELSFFGSKVLHPKTLTPIASRRIETWSRNSFNPSARGTRIGPADSIQYATGPGPVRGISCLSGVALVSVSGAGLKGRRGIAARVFSAVSRSGASVLLITQSSSEFTISFCVRENETETVRRILNEEFVHEMQDKLVNEVS